MSGSKELHSIVKKIPKGKITTPSSIAKALGLNPDNYKRAIGQEVYKCKIPEKYRVVLIKNGKYLFPHQDDLDDCKKRADFLKKEDISICEDNKGIENASKFFWEAKGS